MLLPRLHLSGLKQWQLPASKSLSNRWLVINYLYGGKIDIQNLSTAEDTVLMYRLLQQLSVGTDHNFDCGNAGTVARFITALFASQNGTFVVTGDERMKARPMAELIETMRDMGAEIHCLEGEGFLPLEIHGTRLSGGEVRLSGTQSSQFASALMLVAPVMEQPLTLKFDTVPASESYISMTCELLKACGHSIWQHPLEISVKTTDKVYKISVSIENDWSSAAYAYNAVAFSPDMSVFLPGLDKGSVQGDSVAREWYSRIGVETTFVERGILLKNKMLKCENPLLFECSDNPDLVPPMVVACAGLGLEAVFRHVHTLNLKESERLSVLSKELSKLGCRNVATDDSLYVYPSQLSVKEQVKTYNDHRIAMSFATLACLFDGVDVENPDVVGKSFPNFWNEFLNPKQL